MTTPDPQAPGAYSPPIESFKKEMQFDARIAADDRSHVVKHDWSTLPDELSRRTGLEVEMRSISPEAIAPGLLVTRLVVSGTLRRTNASISVTQAADLDAAAALFLGEVSNTSFATIPFRPGPADLGTVSAIYESDGPGGSVIWVYKNLCVDVRASDAAVALELARVIESIARRSLAPAQER